MLIQHTTETMQNHLQRLLTLEETGDHKPTDLLRRIQALNENLAPAHSALLKELFVWCLTSHVCMILTTSPSSTLDSLAQLADKIINVGIPSVVKVHRPPDPPPLSGMAAGATMRVSSKLMSSPGK